MLMLILNDLFKKSVLLRRRKREMAEKVTGRAFHMYNAAAVCPVLF